MTNQDKSSSDMSDDKGQRYGTREHPAVVTHTNAGVTFDIAAIRPTLSDLKVVRFEALCGVSQEAGNTCHRKTSLKT